MKIKNKNTILFHFFIIFLLILIVVSTVSGTSVSSAESIIYSSVLEDLKKDASFNENLYPTIDTDNSLEVLQIAESSSGELFIYIYQPAAKYTATSIDFSTTSDENGDFIFFYNYKLRLLSQSGVFSKYLVENFEVADDEVRYYNITDVYRTFDETVDEQPSGDGNITTEVAYAVGQLWAAETKDGNVEYSCVVTDVLEVTAKYVGFLRYEDGFFLSGSSCDSHYIAFSTDKFIENLYEAEVTYTQKFGTKIFGSTSYGDLEKKYIVIDYTDVAVSTDNVLFKDYSWDRVQSTKDFLLIEGDKLTDAAKTSIANCDWILRFAETPYVYGTLGLAETFCRIENVSLLRLKFESFGKVYNLGVVDNKTTGKATPDNKSWWNDLIASILSILGAIVVIALLVLFFPILRPIVGAVLNGIWFVIKNIFIGLWWLISAPFSVFE